MRANPERLWKWLSFLAVVLLAASWAPALDLPLGDDHQGRALGRLALQADNFLDKGWDDSSYISEWEPYASAPYAHHPPLTQFVHAAVGWMQGGASALGARLVGYVVGLLSVVILVYFVRRLTRSWLATSLSTLGFAVSGYFWFFGRSLNLVFVLAFFAAHHYSKGRPSSLTPFVLWGLALLGALQSWENALIVSLIALYDFLKGNRRMAVGVAVGVALGIALDLWWIESAAGISALRNHLEARVAAADYGLLDWILRQGGFYLRFESVPVFVLTVIGMVAGLRDRRFRPYVLASLVAVVAFAGLFYQNAWVHEYWNWRISLVLALGLGAVGASMAERQLTTWLHVVVLVFAATLASVPALRLGSDLYAIQYIESSKAGALVDRNDFPSDQAVAWHYGGLAAPRWYSWYTNLPTQQIDLDRPPPSNALVLVKRNAEQDVSGVDTIDSFGHYILVTSQDLVEAQGDRDDS